ncbi:hypothetical protein [Sphingomonas jeddahensis]|uniref:Curlin minor subunit CsgB n=1 Tax=Sphingomonas jeddahensis TaxID=1915074 RepID=A0A1V2ESS4_9SPHN|nr:hypothetical protein [Sphingomonas jeddahensis]ONF95721.1 curlin minor subunit CsgB [Sphingomonas jeddahensis]
MRRLLLAACLAGTSLAVVPTAALAATDKETPGTPCTPGGGAAVGNPCNGNNGNPSPEGNAGEKVRYDKRPDRFAVIRGGGGGAFIHQIGEGNRAAIIQSHNAQYARIDQNGQRNTASATQSGLGAHYARVTQEGPDNLATLVQSAEGAQVAYLTQNGASNVMNVTQNGGGLISGVEALQIGDRNTMSLTQNGENNMARLTQNGSDSAMTAVQNGNNQLTWTQTGVGLSDLQITQPAGQALLVTQTR